MTWLDHSPDTTLTRQSLLLPEPGPAPSLFTGHALKPTGKGSREMPAAHPDWITGILIGGFIMVTWAYVFYFKRIRQIIQAPFSKCFINQLVRDGNLLRERVALVLAAIYFLSFALLLFILNERYDTVHLASFTGFTFYLLILGGLLLFWMIKFLFINLLAVIFKTQATSGEYLLNLVIFNLMNGLVLLPLMVLTLYLRSEYLLFICLIFSLLLFLFRFVRGFLIGITLTKFSYLFLFVYLCTLEILPLLILLKFLIYHV
jgi:hypothetical protein